MSTVLNLELTMLVAAVFAVLHVIFTLRVWEGAVSRATSAEVTAETENF